jgi:hypothetical protein
MDLLGLPATIRERLAPAGRAIYASALAKHAGKSEAVAHAWAWAAIENAGLLPYPMVLTGTLGYIAKDDPGAGDVHVDGPLGALISATKPKKRRSELGELVRATTGVDLKVNKAFPPFDASKHPHGAHGHFAPTGHAGMVDMTGAPELPKWTVTSATNKHEQKHFDLMHAHAMAGNLAALKSYPVGKNPEQTYTKHKTAYKAQLIQILEEHHANNQHAALAVLKKPPTVGDIKAKYPNWDWEGPQQKWTLNKVQAIEDLSDKGDLAALKAHVGSKATNPNKYAKEVQDFHAAHIAYHEQLAGIDKPAEAVVAHPAIAASPAPELTAEQAAHVLNHHVPSGKVTTPKGEPLSPDYGAKWKFAANGDKLAIQSAAAPGKMVELHTKQSAHYTDLAAELQQESPIELPAAKPAAKPAGELSMPAPQIPGAIASPSQPPSAGSGAGHFGATLKLAELTKTGGQLGSNPGGKYEDPSGHQFYVKHSQSTEHAKNELLAAALYKAAGAPTLDYHPVDLGEGKLGVATRWAKTTPFDHSAADKEAAAEHFAAHAWLANWDAVGLAHDNQAIVNGKMTTLDTGGALLYRAQGAPKGRAFSTKVPEWESMRDKAKSPQAASVFGSMPGEQLKGSAAKVAAVSDDQIHRLVFEHGPGDQGEKALLAAKLILRKQDLLKQAGITEAGGEQTAGASTAPKWSRSDSVKPIGPGHNQPPKIDESSLPAKPKFETKNKEVLAVNMTLADQLHALAAKGDIEALKTMAGSLPSQSMKLKDYHESLVSAVHNQLHPPPGLVSIAQAHAKLLDVSAAFPPVTITGAKALKEAKGYIGRYGILGEAEPINMATKGWGTGDITNTVGQHKTAWAGLTEAERGAVKSYTGSAYGGMTAALGSGDLGKTTAKTAAKAIAKAAQPLPVGMMLSRRIPSNSVADKEFTSKLLGSTGKVIIDPSITSTSTIKDFWHGDVHLHLTAGHGAKGLWVAHSGMSKQGPGEGEVILPAGHRIHVTRTEKKGGETYVHGIILPHDEPLSLVKALLALPILRSVVEKLRWRRH